MHGGLQGGDGDTQDEQDAVISSFLLFLSCTIWAQVFIHVGVYFFWMEFCVKSWTNFIFGGKLCMTLIFPNEL